ncbi:hypothetical protein JK628_03530 [Shewanella sp. KX20019]|uniref:DUF4144 family protein n=1 Tax=Shewanella sp. KX20019 TaxID=2803864 RepID=UPI001926449A|nr:DUF4144 family protein [Shewanella sp. KX20019]QQX80955.1 hypothetical protein JK628_03530 [Shewanella sp. KX20019]
MMFTLEQVSWPIILLQKNSNELLRLESLPDWFEKTELLGVLQDSFIIDYCGDSYLIIEDHPPRLQCASAQLSLGELRHSVQLYASQNGHCCTSKLTLNTIEQLFEIVAFIEQN